MYDNFREIDNVVLTGRMSGNPVSRGVATGGGGGGWGHVPPTNYRCPQVPTHKNHAYAFLKYAYLTVLCLCAFVNAFVNACCMCYCLLLCLSILFFSFEYFDVFNICLHGRHCKAVCKLNVPTLYFTEDLNK